MKQAEKIFIVFLSFVSVMVIKEGLGLPLKDGFAPGPGYLPVVIGILLLINCLFLFYKNIKTKDSRGFFKETEGLKRLVIFVVSLIFVVVVGEKLGIITGLTIFMVVVYRFIEKYPLGKCITVAVVSNAIYYLVFDLWLGINLPGIL